MPVACRNSPSSTCCCCRSARSIALVWANTRPESYFRFTYAIAFAVNDVAMVFFFALITKEVVEATAPGGVLHPVAAGAAAGHCGVRRDGRAGAALHSSWLSLLDEPMLAGRVAGRASRRISPSLFRRANRSSGGTIRWFRSCSCSAIASDAIGFVAVALSTPTRDVRLVGGAASLAVAIAVAAALRRCESRASGRISSPPAACRGTRSSGAACTRRSRSCRSCRSCRTRRAIPDSSSTPAEGAKDTLSRFEIWWRYPAQIALFFFGLVNAGVSVARPRARDLGTADCGLIRQADRPADRGGRRRDHRLSSATPRRLARARSWVGSSPPWGSASGSSFVSAPAGGSAALGDEHGCAAEPRGGAARPCGREIATCGEVCEIVKIMTIRVVLILVILILFRPITAAAGHDAQILLRLSSGRPTAGRVVATITVLEGTVNVPGVDVELVSLDGNIVIAKTITDGAGQANFPDVPAGRYMIRGTRPGFQSRESAPFNVHAGQTAQVLLDFRADVCRAERGGAGADVADPERAARVHERHAVGNGARHCAAQGRRLPESAAAPARHHPWS